MLHWQQRDGRGAVVSRHPLRFGVILATATCLAVLLLPGVASAFSTGSGGWRWQSPLPQGAEYAGGYFVDATHGWLIAGGDIFHTSDGGATLIVQARHNVTFNDITFADVTHGWAVGRPADPNRGTLIIYRTVNGGRTWVRVPLHLIGELTAVSFADRNVGWAVSSTGHVLHSTDGGAHWTRQSVQRAAQPWWSFCDVQALSVRQAWIGGQRDADGDPSFEGLLRTSDSGATWKRVKAGLGGTVHRLFFSSPSSGWIMGEEGAAMHTSDGGAHWRRQPSPKPNASFQDLVFADSRNGWAVSRTWMPSSGTVYHTTDGGAHWVSQQKMSNDLAWVQALTRSKVVVGGAGGFLSRTADGGTTWRSRTRVAAGLAGDLHALQFIDATTGWAAGTSGEIVKTTDGGRSWTAQSSATTQTVNDVDFLNATDGWAVGDAGTIVQTSDGGVTWAPQSSGVTDNLTGVSFVDARHGWAVGRSVSPIGVSSSSSGVILATVDGGLHWVTQTEPDPAAVLNDVVFADPQHGWAVGEVPGDSSSNVTVIFSTSDGGATWATQLRFVPLIAGNTSHAQLRGIACIDATHLVAVGSDDRSTEIWRTSDGGQTWNQFQFPDPSSWSGFVWLPLSDVVFADASHGWAVAGGEFIRTTDGGVTWTRQTAQAVGPTDGLNAVSFVSATRGWAAGSAGSILTTTTGGEAP
jgi:photosystem II stability/assembly factor-like uncharacterized protein